MEILFTECPIASVLLADWNKYPIKLTVVQPAFLFLDCIWINPCSCSYLLQPDFLPWSTFGVISVLATIYSNRIFSIYITIGVTSLFLLLLLLYDLLRIF